LSSFQQLGIDGTGSSGAIFLRKKAQKYGLGTWANFAQKGVKNASQEKTGNYTPEKLHEVFLQNTSF
jgi:hypothetical protein